MQSATSGERERSPQVQAREFSTPGLVMLSDFSDKLGTVLIVIIDIPMEPRPASPV